MKNELRKRRGVEKGKEGTVVRYERGRGKGKDFLLKKERGRGKSRKKGEG